MKMPGICKWFRKRNGKREFYSFFVQLGKRQINLGPDEQQAKEKYHRLMLQQGYTEPDEQMTVQELTKSFLEWSSQEHESDTTDWYRRFLEDFCLSCGKTQVAKLKPFQVENWCDDHGWTGATRRCAIVSVKRLVSWSVKKGYIKADPIKERLETPTTTRRERILTPEERRAIYGQVTGPFKAFLWVLEESGARPGELARATAENLQGDTLVFDKHKTRKKTGKPRVIYLTPAVARLLSKLAAERAQGPLFLNHYGKPYTRNAIRIWFRKIRAALKLKGVVAYTLRHQYCTDGLERGVPIATMSELLGHSSTRMVQQHYSHLDQKKDYLRQAALQARGVSSGNGSSE